MKKTTHKMKRSLTFLIATLIALMFLFIFNRKLLSVTAMSISNLYLSPRSIPSQLGLSVDLPLEAMDLYPLMVTFNDDNGLSARLGQDVAFTVEYSFADFNTSLLYSDIYLPDAQLYSCYVGVYYLYGIGSQMTEHMAWSVAEFDVVYLALPSIGLAAPHVTFNVIGTELRKTKNHSGFDWLVIQSPLRISGHAHEYKGFELGYIQFGLPPTTTESYPETSMYGMLHYTYLKDLDLNIALFAIAKDFETLTQLEEKILFNAKLSTKVQ